MLCLYASYINGMERYTFPRLLIGPSPVKAKISLLHALFLCANRVQPVLMNKQMYRDE